MSKSKKKKPSVPSGHKVEKKVIIPDEVDSNLLHPVWSFAEFDQDILLNKGSEHTCRFCEIAAKLKNYESMTWGQILNNDHRDHSVEIKDLEPFAIERLKQLNKDPEFIEELFRFRFTGLERLWGIRDRQNFKLLWWDPYHEICPSKKKGT